MSESKTLLVELFTEELPPKALQGLGERSPTRSSRRSRARVSSTAKRHS